MGLLNWRRQKQLKEFFNLTGGLSSSSYEKDESVTPYKGVYIINTHPKFCELEADDTFLITFWTRISRTSVLNIARR